MGDDRGQGQSTRGNAAGSAGGAAAAPPELPLPGVDVRLPWLEADDDDAGARRGVSLFALVIAGIAVLALLGLGAWLFERARQAETLVANGGVIRAPQGPYKVRPSQPGGDIAAGTGDTSFIVAEGKTRPVHLGAGPDTIAAAGTPASSAGAIDGIGVQLGAYSSAAAAEAAWPKLVVRYPVLAGHSHRVIEATADMGVVFGLQAVSPNADAASMLCATLRDGGLNCRVKD